MASLECTNLTKRFGGNVAVNDCTFSVRKSQIVGLIGPNGSGKTTVFNLISGVHKADEGEILFNNENIKGLKSHEIAWKGIGRLFQIARIFPTMTVLENMLAASYYLNEERQRSTEKALSLLEMMDLVHLQDEYAKNLSGGQQRLLEFIRLFMMDITLALLDEPFVGVHPTLIEKMIDQIKYWNEKGKTFLVVSHDIRSIMSICNPVLVLYNGQVIAEGTPSAIQQNKNVIQAYLGV